MSAAAVLGEVGRLVRPLGFLRTSPRSQTFARPFPHGRWFLHVIVARTRGCLHFGADVAIRFDEVEDLTASMRPNASRKELGETATIGARLGNIRNGRAEEFALEEGSTASDVAKEIVSMFEEVGLPYLQEFGDPARAYEALQHDDRPSWLHNAFHTSRAAAAFAFAVLLDEPDFEALVSAKLAFVEPREPNGAKRLEALAEQLRVRRADASSG